MRLPAKCLLISAFLISANYCWAGKTSCPNAYQGMLSSGDSETGGCYVIDQSYSSLAMTIAPAGTEIGPSTIVGDIGGTQVPTWDFSIIGPAADTAQLSLTASVNWTEAYPTNPYFATPLTDRPNVIASTDFGSLGGSAINTVNLTVYVNDLARVRVASGALSPSDLPDLFYFQEQDTPEPSTIASLAFGLSMLWALSFPMPSALRRFMRQPPVRDRC
jgi:hypothetical protein